MFASLGVLAVSQSRSLVLARRKSEREFKKRSFRSATAFTAGLLARYSKSVPVNCSIRHLKYLKPRLVVGRWSVGLDRMLSIIRQCFSQQSPFLQAKNRFSLLLLVDIIEVALRWSSQFQLLYVIDTSLFGYW
jgi:hypothetical protein